jgi:hypothetical protein
MEDATGSGAGDWLRAEEMRRAAKASIAEAESGTERWRIIGSGPERTPDPTYSYTAEAKLAGGIDEDTCPFFPGLASGRRSNGNAANISIA